MRLFIAVDMPADVVERLVELQKQIRGGKFTFVKHFHLTLKFLGKVQPDKLSAVKAALAKFEFKSFKAELGSVGFFSPSAVRVVWAGLEPKDVFSDFQKCVEQSLKGIFEPELRFESHVTLARVKFLDNPTEFKEQLKKLVLKPVQFKVDNFKLYESVLTKSGPDYSLKAVYNLSSE